MAERKPAAASGGGASRAPGLGAGILIGVLLGIGLALAVAIWLNVRGSPFSEREVPAELPALKVPPPVAPAQAPPAVAKPADAAEDEAGNGQRFDFYEILPGTEATAVARPRINLPVALYLQAGAFRSPTDADDRKAQLNLLGQTAVVQRVQVGESLLHRIRVGPFATQAELEQVRAFLSQNGIDSIPMRPETTASP
jgi:cell division septation protein DedD